MNEIAVFRLHKLSFLIRSRFKNKVKVFVLERNINKECVFDLFCFVLFLFFLAILKDIACVVG